MLWTVPVMYEDPSQSNHAISSATSEALPSRPIGIFGNFDTPSVSFDLATIGVSIGPLK
jgi:hypothetical protein